MDFNDLTPEQQEKAKACKTPEEILELARKEGQELSIDDLDEASGGWSVETCKSNECPYKSCGTLVF